jgi:hypothetical protein
MKDSLREDHRFRFFTKKKQSAEQISLSGVGIINKTLEKLA